MAALSDYVENQVLDHIFRGATFTKPAGVFMALFTTAQDDAGVAGVEVSGGSYARVDLSQGDASFLGTHGTATGASSGTTGTISNTADIVFPTPTANWGSIVGIGLYDAATGGNLLMHNTLTTPKTVNNGDPGPKFLSGGLSATLA